MKPRLRARLPSGSLPLTALTLAIGLLVGCTSLTPDSGLSEVQQLTQGRTAGLDVPLQRKPGETSEAVNQLLAAPVSAESAVRIALLNNPALQAAFATLDISDAARAQAGQLPNPHLTLGRFTDGDVQEIERVLRFDVIGLLFLPWKAKWQNQQHELTKLQAAQTVIRLASDTRKAWISAVAAQQAVGYLEDVREAAEAGAELAQRMARTGNWSRLQQAREQVFLTDATAQLARARQAAVAAREKLTRLMGLGGRQPDPVSYTLAARLPDLPAQAEDMRDVEQRALRERLDVRSAVAESGYVADALGLQKATGYLNGLTLGITRNTSVDNATGAPGGKRGLDVELSLPIFDWGTARNARAQALYLQSVARVRDVAVKARSEAREAYQGYTTAFELARHYRDEVVPLRQRISEEMLLRYNGMLLSVWDLLSDMRQQVMSVNSAIEAQRDFWLAEADLQTTLTGTSPGGLAGLQSVGIPTRNETQGH